MGQLICKKNVYFILFFIFEMLGHFMYVLKLTHFKLTVYLEQCTQTGSDEVHPFSAACLVILCAFLKSKQSIL